MQMFMDNTDTFLSDFNIFLEYIILASTTILITSKENDKLKSFTKNRNGEIIIKVYPSTDEEFLTIKVVDNGSGIDSNYISKIFNRFYHHGGNMDRYVNGFGIGLSLTKSMIELHKGTILVNSELQKGTTFTLNLPMDEGAYSYEEKSDRVLWDNDLPKALSITYYDQGNEVETSKFVDKNVEFNEQKPIILFVDDNKDLIDNLADYFMEHYNIYKAENGQIGFEIANKLQPDIIISDLVMPIMNGIELCETLKNDIKTSHIPIILLTAQGDMNTQFEGVKSGADYFVPKPFNIKKIISEMFTKKYKKLFIFEFSRKRAVCTKSGSKPKFNQIKMSFSQSYNSFYHAIYKVAK
jgi:CheY-like chemotaxis protein